MIVFALGASRKESKRMHTFLNKEDGFVFNLETDLNNMSWDDSENIIINRINKMQNKIYNNTNSNNQKFKVIGEVAFYIFPYIELMINNFPYLKFVCVQQNRKKTYEDIISDIKMNNNFLMRFLFFKKEYKNHWMNHDGRKWEKDYILDKCYPKFDVDSLKMSIDKYIDLYHSGLKKMQKKYPNNLNTFYLDEFNSKYGKQKILSFIGLK